MACAIAQAAVVVLPTWGKVKARIEAPRGIRRKISCQGVELTPKDVAHPHGRIDVIGCLT
jgi:hypothetical protein